MGGLHDSRGYLLAFNDDTISGGEIVDTNFRIPWTLAPGVYYVAVFSTDGTTTGNYTCTPRQTTTDIFLTQPRPCDWIPP